MLRNSMFFAALLAVSLMAQDKKPGAVEGVVTNALTGEPLNRAHVVMRAGARGPIRKYGAIANVEGKFSIRQIDPGNYELTTDLPGFLTARGPAEPKNVEVKPGESVSDLKLKMVPQGVIAGRVVDASGNPVEHVTVEAWRGPRMQSDQPTQENGEFRLSGLRAGKYLLRAVPPGGSGPPEIRTDGTREEYYQPTYYPRSATEEGAGAVEARAGAEVTGLEFRLARSPIVCVRGEVTGLPPGVIDAQIRWSDSLSSHDSRARGGQFTLWRLPPGKIRLEAFATDSQGRLRIAAPEDIDLGTSDLDHVELTLMLPFDITGAIAWDGDAPAGNTNPAILRLNPIRSGDDSPTSKAGADGTFRLSEVDPDRYRVTVEGMPAGVYVKTLRLGAAEMPGRILDVRHGTGGAPLTVTLSTAGAQVSGVVHSGQAASSDTPVALVAEAAGGFPHIQTTRTGPDGSYIFRSLAPGAYRIFALDADDADSAVGPYEQDAERIEVAERDRTTLNLKLRP